MLKVLVVDDETLVRELIIRCVNWKELGLEIAGTAGTAQEALERVEELEPDILFTDVRMPVMTGLELGRSVLENHPEIKVIVVSGYDEFSYVNEGLKMGIFDYILKPIKQEVLQEVACRARDAILEERQHQEEFSRLKQEFEQNAGLIKKKQLELLVTSNETETILERLEYFGVQWNCFVNQVAAVEFEGADEEGEENGTEQELMHLVQFTMLIEDFFTPYTNIFTFERGLQRIVIINNQMEEGFEGLCNCLKQRLMEEMHTVIRIGIGELYPDIRQLRISYVEARDALKCSFSFGLEQSACYRDISRDMGEDAGIQDSFVNKIGYYLRQGMDGEVQKILKESYDSMKCHAITKEKGIVLSMQYMMEMISALAELKVPAEYMTDNEARMIGNLMTKNSLEEIQAYLGDVAAGVSGAILKQNEAYNRDVVKKVEVFLEENYGNPEISLAEIARTMYVNPNYLSRAFKKKTGQTFREYLMRIRMQNAMRLLRQTDLRSFEVAERVGIVDPSYFSVCFKKVCGMSVQEFKKSI